MSGILNTTDVAEALKDYYLEGLRYQLNDKASVLLAQLERNSEDVSGEQIVMALRYGRHGGVGNRADDGTLPTANSRKTKKAKWATKNLFARFQITDKVIKASRNDKGAFARMLTQEIEDCETDAKLDHSRQALGDGTGALATISSVSTLVLTVDSTMYFAEGMLVDIYTTTTKDTSEAEVTAVDHDALTVTVSSATGAAANDVIYVAGNKGLELTGLDAVFAQTGSIYGLDRATYPWLKAQRINVNGEIAEVKIQEAIDKGEVRAGSVIDLMLCSMGVRRAYYNLQLAQKSHVNTLELKSGWKALAFTGGNQEVPLTADKYVEAGKIYCLDMSDWAFYHMGDYEWLDADGAMLSRVANKAAWEATLARYADIGCAKPKGQIELYGIVEH